MKPIHALLPALAAIALTACAPAQVKLPAGFAERADAYAVSGHSPRRFNQPIHVGPYSARRMEDGDTFGWALAGSRLAWREGARSYAFTVTTQGQPPVEVQCDSRQSVLRHDDGDSSLELELSAFRGPVLSCGLRVGNAGPVMVLELAVASQGFEGNLDSPWGTFALHSLHGFEGSAWSAMDANGFEVVRAGEPWMVVETINAGRVLMAREAAPRQRVYLAAAGVALLMFEAELAG